jgi:hypothetical protein
VNAAKNRNSCDPLQNRIPVKKIHPGNAGKKRKPQESWQEQFFGPKNKFLKTGITNLDVGQSLFTIKTNMPIPMLVYGDAFQ